MATWIAHMRIAEHFMKKDARLNNEQFLVGNIGPDCGVPNEDWSAFTPDTAITHWKINNGKDIDAEDFRQRYLQTKDSRFPFYLGYYIHLLTDIEWAKRIYQKKRLAPAWAGGLDKDPNFIWEIKKDWYGQDHLFLQRNPDFVFYTMFAKIDEFPNVYFDFYPPDAFIRQIKYITEFYTNAKEDPDRAFPYLSRDEMDGFVSGTIEILNGFPSI